MPDKQMVAELVRAARQVERTWESGDLSAAVRQLASAADHVEEALRFYDRAPSANTHEYRVTWEIDVDAATPSAAAEEALAIMRDPESMATVFRVQSGPWTTVVDLLPDAKEEGEGHGNHAQPRALSG